MKIAYKHLIKKIGLGISIEEISEKLFQLGHEHEIHDDIFEIEITPNRGDCLSVMGILRDLKLFYDIDEKSKIYTKEIDPFNFNFINSAKDHCKKISFLKIEIEDIPNKYRGSLNDYFLDLEAKRNNFFTDVSNFISYETGQPTHCYDGECLNNHLELSLTNKVLSFQSLFDKEIQLEENELVFLDEKSDIVNLAGIVGGKATSCNGDTKSTIIECAHFDPEIILGKSVKYDVKSDASYKFERNTDISCHDYVLRRFIQIVNEHSRIKKVQIFSESYNQSNEREVIFNSIKLDSILGIQVDKDLCIDYLSRLGFLAEDDLIKIPHHRNDIHTMNDIAEEIARAIGFDNIKSKKINISINKSNKFFDREIRIKNLLIDNGFFEVINNPFVAEQSNSSIQVDNPLDSNKFFLRTDLKQSLIENLLYNERRQNDSIKLFEISKIYDLDFNSKTVIGIIASGRLDKNYKDFSKKIDNNLIAGILKKEIPNIIINFIEIPRNQLETKLSHHISYFEIDLDLLEDINYQTKNNDLSKLSFTKYEPISEFPSSTRDISFSIAKKHSVKSLENLILGEEHELLKEIFVFDYFANPKTNNIKLGFRFVFQSKISTITDREVDNIISKIINKSLLIESVSVPGL